MSLQKHKSYRNKKMREAARGEECTVNGPLCNYNPETSVLAHLNESFAGKGMSLKAEEDASFISCGHCHALYDGQIRPNGAAAYDWEKNKYFYLLRAVVRTRKIFRDKGIL